MRKPNLTAMILIGLLLGIFVGVFFGERAAVLNPVGTAFIRFLQMAVLPYFIVALPLGFGRLSFEEAKMLGKRLVLFSLAIWSPVRGYLVEFLSSEWLAKDYTLRPDGKRGWTANRDLPADRYLA